MTDIALRTNGGQGSLGFFTSSDKRTKDALEAKRTHFQLGNHPRIAYSQQRLSYQDYNKNNHQFGKMGSSISSQKSNFEIGDQRLKNVFYTTTYGIQTDSQKYAGFQRTIGIDNKNFHSSINHGAPKPQVLYSQNTLAYRPVTAAPSKQDKEFIKHIKSNHFEFGAHGTPNLYCSVSMQNFNYKGDASSIRAKLDQAKKEDLRRSHFNVGKESYNLVSQQTLAYRPLTASAATLNAAQKAQLRASHWGVGEKSTTQVGGSTPFVTNNMINYKWVQPQPQKY